MLVLLIFVGAGLGGVARHAVGGWIQTASAGAFPWSTLLINVTGSLLLAALYAMVEGSAAAPQWRAFLGVGVLGGYTTFSTFSVDALRLLQAGEAGRALLYVAGSVVLSLAAAALGLRAGAIFLERA